MKLDLNLNEMKSCLAQGFPFAFGIRLFKSFDRGGKTGKIPKPQASEESRRKHAG
jgi:hypothetical protein